LYPQDLKWHPEDVGYETWNNWFKEIPPLKAKLTFRGEKLN
jgi:hypothetical protein